MVFKEYKFGAWKKEIRNLLRERIKLTHKILFAERKIRLHKENIYQIKNESLPEIETKLNYYLKLAGNDI